MINARKLASQRNRLRALAMSRIHQSLYVKRNGTNPAFQVLVRRTKTPINHRKTWEILRIAGKHNQPSDTT